MIFLSEIYWLPHEIITKYFKKNLHWLLVINLPGMIIINLPDLDSICIADPSVNMRTK